MAAATICGGCGDSGEIQQALVITNATGRISDLRRKGETDGFTVIGVKRPDGHMGFHIRPTGELTLGLAS
jgi:hypothetical protein